MENYQKVENREGINQDRENLARRIDQIIAEVNTTSLGGRSNRYVGGKMKECKCVGGLIDDKGINGTGNVSGSGLSKYGEKNTKDRLLHLDYDMVDKDGVLRQFRSAEGYDLDDVTIRPRVGGGCTGGNCVGGNGIHNETPLSGGAKKPRKKRTDTGKQRGASEWVQFVKAVQEHDGMTYKEAMSAAAKDRKSVV